MPISINIFSLGDIGKIVADKFGADKKAAKEWLEAVACEADGLAEAWTEIYEAFYKQSEITPSALLGLRYDVGWRNRRPFSRLQKFYSYASTVLPQKYKERQQFIDILGALLYGRELTKNGFEGIISSIAHGDGKVDLEELKGLVNALQKDAATIHVLAKSYH